MKTIILVPYYNEEKNLFFFIKEWEKFLIKKKRLSKNVFFLFIDDGSTDNSSQIIKSTIKDLKFKIIKKKNSGHADTCKFGYNLIIKLYKKYDHVLQIDSDNQCDPKYLLKINEIIKYKENKFVFGYRKTRDDGYLRFLISKILTISFFLKKFTYVKDLNTPYRMMNILELKRILYFLKRNKKYKNIQLFNCVLSYGAKRYSDIKWININFRKRKYGISKYKFLDMLSLYLNLILKI